MELEEMKERWAALNDCLERTEMLQESVIRELVQTKGEKSVSQLINWETFGFVVTILIIPYSIYVYHRFGGHFAMWDLFIRVAIVVDGLLVLWTGYKLYGLMKIDFTKVVKENILRVNRYTVQITREKIFTAAIIGPLFVILSVVMSIEMKAPDFIWGVLFGDCRRALRLLKRSVRKNDCGFPFGIIRQVTFLSNVLRFLPMGTRSPAGIDLE